jgi:hypothetical protein
LFKPDASYPNSALINLFVFDIISFSINYLLALYWHINVETDDVNIEERL